MPAATLAIATPDAFGGVEERRRIQAVHEDNLERLRRDEPVVYPDAGEDEDSLSGRVREYHELTKDEIQRHGERTNEPGAGPERYRIPDDARRDVADLTEMTAEKIERQNRRAYIAALVIGVLVFGPFVTFVSYVL